MDYTANQLEAILSRKSYHNITSGVIIIIRDTLEIIKKGKSIFWNAETFQTFKRDRLFRAERIYKEWIQVNKMTL